MVRAVRITTNRRRRRTVVSAAPPPDKAGVWAALWEKLAPGDMRQLPVRHKAAGGELMFAKAQLARQWKFDWCIPSLRIAVEVDGGVENHPVTCDKCGKPVEYHTSTGKRARVYAANGRHTRAQGYKADCEKLNSAAMLGWLVLRFTPDMLKKAPVPCVEMVAQAVRVRRRETGGE